MNGTRQRTVTSSQQGRRNAGATTFAFRKRWDSIDWRALASVDVDRIALEMDFQALQHNIMNVTFCNIHSEDFHNVDPNFIKLFRLAQLIIEYLLHTQQYLTEQISVLEQQTLAAQQELEAMKEQFASRDDELKAVRRENRKRRKMIESYQEMMNAGATGLHPCPVCKREFVSAEYVHSHMQRRHPDHPSLQTEPPPKPIDPEEIKGRILEHLNEQLQASEAQLRADLANKEQQAMEDKIKEFEEWKKQYRDQMKRDFHDYKESVFTELRQQQMGRERMQEELQQAKAELDSLKNKRFSYLGHLEGADEIDFSGKKTEQKMLQMKEHLMDEMQQQMRKQNKSWKKRLQTMADMQHQQLQESQAKVRVLELSLQEALTKTTHEQQDSAVADKLRSLQQAVQEHDQQLSSQQQNLSELQDGGFATPPVSIPPSPVKQQEQVEDEEEEEEEDDTSISETTEFDEGSYTPFQRRPYVKCWYSHTPNQIQTARTAAEEILNDALNRRGIHQGATSMNEKFFNEKMRILQHQRQAQVQTHYNFMEHRERLCQRINQQAVRDCKSDLIVFPLVDVDKSTGVLTASTTGSGKKRKTKEAASSTAGPTTAMSKKPPVPTTPKQPQPSSPVVTPVKRVQLTSPQSSPIQPPSSTRTTVTFDTAHTVTQQNKSNSNAIRQQVKSDVRQQVKSDVSTSRQQAAGSSAARTIADEDGLESVSELSTLDSDTETESQTTPRPTATNRTPVQLLTIDNKDKDDSSVFDSDDSFDKLMAPPTSSRAYSTPIKNDAGKKQSVADKAKKLDVVLSGGLNQSKRPIGGVPVLLTPDPPLEREPSDDSDTFTLTDSSTPVHPPRQPQPTYDEVISMMPTSETTDTEGGGGRGQTAGSRTGTSRSILTTVTAADDFDDSDFSDLEVTHLT